MLRIMKLAVVFALLFAVGSCRPLPYMLGKPPQAEPPYIRFNDGKLIHPKVVGEEVEFQGSRIVADTIAYARTDVTDFSDGQQTYYRLEKGKFGPRIVEGSINVYSSFNALEFGYPEHDLGNTLIYIQDGRTSPLRTLSYKSLRSMIPKSSPASVELDKFKHTRTITRFVELGGIVSMIGGTVLASNGVLKNNNTQTNIGVPILFGGMGVFGFSVIPLFTNRLKLKRAIAIRNGVFPANK